MKLNLISRELAGWRGGCFELNKALTGLASVDQIARFVCENVRSFYAVNVATACHRLAKMCFQACRGPDDTGPRGQPHGHNQEVRRAIEMLLTRALETVQSFKPQNVANLMWALAKLGMEPGAELGLAMSRRAVACAGEFKPQEVANLMWTDAVLCVQSGRFIFDDVVSHPLCAIHLVFQVCVVFISLYAIFFSYEIMQFVFMTRLLRRPFSASFIRRSSVPRWRGCGRACGCRV